jgi:class 3 adenylate cyclase
MEKRERRRAAVLFADIRGFTRLTARLSPDEVVTILNEFFTVMTGIAYSCHGTIFDIAGDELMVGFGVPFELSDPIGYAMQAGIEMQTVFSSLAEKWWQIYGDRRAGMGIGIDYGEVIVGNVGSPSRMNYALVGLSVNTAHALVAAASDGDVRFSEVVMDRFHNRDLKYPITPVTGVQLKGRDKPETVYCMSIGRPANPATKGAGDAGN